MRHPEVVQKDVGSRFRRSVKRDWDAPKLLHTRARKRKKALVCTRAFSSLIGQLPTLPHTRACSTIGAERLNYRVRDGNGWDPLATVTQKSF